MTFSSFKSSLGEFYSACDKPTFFFCLIAMNPLIGFTPKLPSAVYYVSLLGYAFYNILQGVIKTDKLLMAFLVYVPLGLIITSPDSVFRSWERFLLFTLLMACVSPIFTGDKAIRNRRNMFQIVLVICLIIGIGSFFARFLGINYMRTYNRDFMTTVGLFGGLTTHSMSLGLVAGISAIYMAYLGYLMRKRLFFLLSFISVITVMFTASRAALMATIAGITMAIFRLSGTMSKFVVTSVVVVMLGAVSFPLWGGAMDGVISKNEGNNKAGSAISSRESLWKSRINEFENSPITGIGFAAIHKSSSGAAGLDERTGMVESGSSWLIILSMTGIIGAIFLLPVFVHAYLTVYKDNDQFSALVCGILTLFFVHMIAEGYIFYGGSQMAFMMWLTVGVAMDCKYAIEE